MRHGGKAATDRDGDGNSGGIIRSTAGPGVIVGQQQNGTTRTGQVTDQIFTLMAFSFNLPLHAQRLGPSESVRMLSGNSDPNKVGHRVWRCAKTMFNVAWMISKRNKAQNPTLGSSSNLTNAVMAKAGLDHRNFAACRKQLARTSVLTPLGSTFYLSRPCDAGRKALGGDIDTIHAQAHTQVFINFNRERISFDAAIWNRCKFCQ
jgi:hypothetical protein